MTRSVNEYSGMEVMISGEHTGMKVKSIRKNQKNGYWTHFKNCDNCSAGKSKSDPMVKHLRGVKQGGW